MRPPSSALPVSILQLGVDRTYSPPMKRSIYVRLGGVKLRKPIGARALRNKQSGNSEAVARSRRTRATSLLDQRGVLTPDNNLMRLLAMHLFWRVIVVLAACLLPGLALADPLPRSMLVLDQSDVRGPFYYEIFDALRSTVNVSAAPPVTIYAESLNLIRFPGAAYEESLKHHLQVKYQGKQIGVIVAIGVASLEYVLRWRTTLWPGIPVVFSMVDEPDFARLRLPPDVTGSIMRFPLADMMTTARAVVPDLRTVAFVGDSWESQTTYRHWKDEIPIAAAGLEVIDLTGMTMRAVRQRVAVLPEHTAILYSSMVSDGEGTLYPPSDALKLVAETANRPIVISAETYLGYGGIGGFVMTPSLVGRSAAKLAMRVLEGENPTSIPPAAGEILRPIFDWRQMQRWGVSEASLPPGSEIRFRDPTAWDQYRVQILAILATLFVQSGLISWLIFEHRRRHLAEIQSRNAMTELTYMDRRATAGQLSASIAHEVNQPLTGITARASAALRWLRAETPNLEKVGALLEQIVAAGYRASDIITSVRAMYKKDTSERLPVDINALILTVLAIVRIDLQKNGVELQTELADKVLIVEGDKVQLQQVVLNLVMNAIEAMQSVQPRVLKVKSEQSKPKMVHVSIEDAGTGIDRANLNRLFSPLFTTKERGMGMGLSICHSIIENHNGRIWVSPGVVRGSIFQFELPAPSPQGRETAPTAVIE
jgi:signal transduction histidine kinase